MIYLIFFIVGSAISIVGAICGVGGGMVLKPTLDAFGFLDISSVNFLAGVSVFSLSAYNFLHDAFKRQLNFDLKTTTFLAIGAIIGGVSGSYGFELAKEAAHNDQFVKALQMVCILFISIITLYYALNKKRFKVYKVNNLVICLFVGLFLGVLGSFLGIGGGPFNLMIISIIFSLPIKQAAQSNLFIILLSQSSSILQVIINHKVSPNLNILALLILAGSGVVGAIIGKKINKKIDSNVVNILFILFVIAIIVLCGFDLVSALEHL